MIEKTVKIRIFKKKLGQACTYSLSLSLSLSLTDTHTRAWACTRTVSYHIIYIYLLSRETSTGLSCLIHGLSIIWKSDLTDKMKHSFFQAAVRIDTAVWMHYLDANKTAGEEARRQLHKNVASNIEQVLEATPHNAPTIRPTTPISKTIQARKTRHAVHCWRSRDELISDVLQ